MHFEATFDIYIYIYKTEIYFYTANLVLYIVYVLRLCVGLTKAVENAVF